MSINYQSALNTYVAQDAYGVVLGIYDPAKHGTVEEFRHAMTAEFTA